MGPALILITLISLSAAQWPSKEPFWPHYPTRSLQVLDGEWDFGFSQDQDPLTVDPTKVQTPKKVQVPSSFDVAAPGVLGPRGTAFYRTTFSTSKADTNVLLYFTACAFYCRVFVDNVEVGEHRAGGYQPFWLNAPSTSSSGTSRELLVVVNNKFNHTLSPTYTGGDFYFYSGINRNVIVHEQPEPGYIVQVETFTKNYTGILDVNVVLSIPSSPSSVQLSLAWDGRSSAPFKASVSKGVAVLKNLQVPNAKPWSIDNPNLHTLQVNLLDDSGNTVDAVNVRFGLRIVEATHVPTIGTRLTINDRLVKLHGVNRHTMWPDTGAAVTVQQIETDLALLQDLGANYVRGAHYPQDPRFLDRCDELGIVVWEETLGPGVSVKNLQDPYFLKYQIQAVNEMISASINHPAVILHGFYNEGPSYDPAACPGYKASADAIRARTGDPPTRLVTWASNMKTKDVCLDNADVVSFNSYPAWYDHVHDLTAIVPFWQSQVDWVVKNFPEKPFTISETGAGGVYEWTNQTDYFWSQLFQSEVVSLEAKFFMETEQLSGLTIWQFSDIKGDDGATSSCGQCVYKPHKPSLSDPWDCAYINVKCGRPGGENHKGQVDFWRRKKLTFSSLAAIYKNQTK